MDFQDRPDEAAFRSAVREFLSANASRKQPGRSGAVGGFSHQPGSAAELDHIEQAKAWQALLFDNGWAGITWPVEYGGRGATIVEQMIFNQELSGFDVPAGIFSQGIGMAGPTLLGHGTVEQRERHLRPMLRGDVLWCQLFSEPNAGSDLASLRTRAERDGDEYVINGQKVWTSSAHYSDWGILLARTDWDVPKHRGITYFLVDMRSPGIEIRPLRQINGGAHFNEVFLTDVRIPVDQVVGAEGAGWMVTQTTLANERTLIGGGARDTIGPLRQLIDLFGGADDPVVRDTFARCYSEYEIQKYVSWRVQSAILRGGSPGPESSILKLMHTRHLVRTADFAMALAGARAMIDDPADHMIHGTVDGFLMQFTSRIGGGTDEIQRNIVAERVLGLPGDVRADKGVPFRNVVT